MTAAKEAHDFQKAISLRDQIAKLKAGGGGGGGRALDAAKYDQTVAALDHQIKQLSAVENFEACVPLSHTQKKLKDLKREYDSASGPSRLAVLDKLEAALKA